MEFFANKFRSVKKSGNNLPSLANMLNQKNIDYDRVEALLMVEPELIGSIKCSVKDNGLSYEVPEGLHRDVQALNMRALCIICYALSPDEFDVVLQTLSRRKRHYFKSAWLNFQNAKQLAS